MRIYTLVWSPCMYFSFHFHWRRPSQFCILIFKWNLGGWLGWIEANFRIALNMNAIICLYRLWKTWYQYIQFIFCIHLSWAISFSEEKFRLNRLTELLMWSEGPIADSINGEIWWFCRCFNLHFSSQVYFLCVNLNRMQIPPVTVNVANSYSATVKPALLWAVIRTLYHEAGSKSSTTKLPPGFTLFEIWFHSMWSLQLKWKWSDCKLAMNLMPQSDAKCVDKALILFLVFDDEMWHAAAAIFPCG